MPDHGGLLPITGGTNTTGGPTVRLLLHADTASAPGGSWPRSGHSHATASAMVASMGLVASPSRGVVAWRRSMPGGAGVIVISRKRTGLQSHHSSIGCAIALGQSGLACVVLGNVLDLTLCSAGSSTR